MSGYLKVDREYLVPIICNLELKKLSTEERRKIVYNFFSEMNEENDYFCLLDEDIKKEVILQRKGFDIDDESDFKPIIDNPDDSKYDFVILEQLMANYNKKVLDSYIEKRLVELGISNVFVNREDNLLYDCPCCGYFTLLRDESFDGCIVCFWFDTGSSEYSSMNDMTLKEGIENFKLFGACQERFLKILDPRRFEKYKKKDC